MTYFIALGRTEKLKVITSESSYWNKLMNTNSINKKKNKIYPEKFLWNLGIEKIPKLLREAQNEP